MKLWAIVAFVSLGFAGGALADPLDSRGTVYIDGLPCNLPCQSYMAWSRQTLNANQAGAKGTATTSTAKALEEAPHKRISKRVRSASANAPTRRRKTGDLQAALTVTPEPAPLPKPRTDAAPVSVETRDPPPALTTSPEPPAASKLEAEHTPLPVETGNPPKARSPQELVMAALAVADQITKAEMPNTLGDDRATEIKAGDADASRPLVAILLSRPDVKSAAELKGLNVAIDVTQSAAERDIHLALEAAGATEVQLSVSDTSPLERLASGDVPAAVVRLVSLDAAEAFPDIKGFKVLRVPLSTQ